MIRPGWWDLTSWRATLSAVFDKNLPSVTWRLKRIQIETGQVIEEGSFNLTTKYKEFGPKNIQCVAVATRRSRSRRQSARPLLGCCYIHVSNVGKARKGLTGHTGVEKIKGIVEKVSFVKLGVTTKHNEGIANKQACVADSWTWPF